LKCPPGWGIDCVCGNCSTCWNKYNHEDEKIEVLFIIEYALNYLRQDSDSDKFCVPNGSMWTYEEVKNYINKYLT